MPAFGGTEAKRSTTNVTVGDDYYSCSKCTGTVPVKLKVKKNAKVKFVWSSANTDTHNVKLTSKHPKKRQAEGLHVRRLLRGRDVQEEVQGAGHVRLHLHVPQVGDEDRRQGQEVARGPSVDLEPFGRRELFAGTGGLFLCTIAGQKIFADRGEADLGKLSEEIPVPPKVAAAEASGTTGAASQAVLARAGGTRREYWIRAEKAKWNIVPTGRDAMMDQKIKGKTKFTAWAYRPYSANFEAPIGPPTIPGPTIDCQIGDTVVVNFQNMVDSPVTIHPHGIFYAQEMDGAYKGRHTDPGGFVQKKQIFQYVWEARAGHRGVVALPRPRADGADARLQGPLRAADRPPDRIDPRRPRVLHRLPLVSAARDGASDRLLMHQRLRVRRQHADARRRTSARASPSTSSRSTTTSIPSTSTAIAGSIESGTVVDNKTLGPGDSMTASFVEDNPGRWLYHCHVWSHISSGMNGWYIVN